MNQFTHCTIWHGDLFAIDLIGRIWHFESTGGPPLMRHLVGDEPEFEPPIRILRAMWEAARV